MESPLPCRPRSLPSDIWLDIIQCVDEPTIKSLSLVNKLLRDVALPILFSTISISAPISDPNCYPYLEPILQRVNGIESVPRIFNAICQLNLTNWIFDEPGCGMWNDMEFEIVKQKYIVYEAVVGLVSALPRLSRLNCVHCYIPSTIYSSILGSSSLNSLRIVPLSGGLSSNIHLRTFPPSLHVFEYCPPLEYQEDVVTLVFSQADQFTSLYLPINMLLSDSIDFPTNFHKLQKLTLFNLDRFQSVSPTKGERFYGFLSLAPNLRELRVIVRSFSVTPPNVVSPHTMMRNLESLAAPWNIANDIITAFEPPLKKIHLLPTSSEKAEFPADYKVILKDVKHVAYDGLLEYPKRDLTHLARMFPNATSVQITAMRGHHTTHEEISDAIMSVLPTLPHLKKCGIFDLNSHPNDLSRMVGFCCPVGRADDPKYRAHPTLEDVQILSWYRWIWIPEDGWRACDLYYAPVDVFRSL